MSDPASHDELSQHQGAAPLVVAVCIATYRRPAGLARLLRSLADQQDLGPAEMVVVVVDNDPERSAAPVLAEARRDTDLVIVDDHEPRPGVSHARNRTLAMAATAGADHVAVIDDDMVAAPDWLSKLLAARDRFDADVVGGRVERSVDHDRRQWVADLAFFGPITTGIEGAPAHAIELGNSLSRQAVLGVDAFDPSLGAIGGEDTQLFLRLTRAGHRIVTTETALAHEFIGAERTRLGWMLRRALRLGSCWSVIERSVLGPRRLQRSARALGRIARGGLRTGWGLVRLDRIDVVDGVLDAAEGVGMLAGLAGYTVAEYGRSGPRLVRVR